MTQYSLIEDLEKKLSLYRELHKNESFKQCYTHREIAALISRAKVYPAELSREMVRCILEDGEPWPVGDGGLLSVRARVSMQELESARVIKFRNDRLEIIRHVESSPDMPEKLKGQLDALRTLYEIRYGIGCVAPHLRLQSSDVSVSTFMQASTSLAPIEGGYKISLERQDIPGVALNLWRILKAESKPGLEVFKVWLSKIVMASDVSYVFDMEFSGNDERDEFLEAAYKYVEADDSLFESWDKIAADIALDVNRIGSIVEMGRVVAFGSDGRNDSPPQYYEQLDLEPLAGVIARLLKKPREGLLEAYQWWMEAERHSGHYGMVHNIVWAIVSGERNLYNVNSSFPITRRLFELSNKSPRLLGVLVSGISAPKYLCYLLSNLSTNHLGLVRISNELQRSGRGLSEQVDYERLWWNLAWTQALEIYVGSHYRNVHEGNVVDVLQNIGELIVWISDRELGFSSKSTSIRETLIPQLKLAVESIRYFSVNTVGEVSLIRHECHHMANLFMASPRGKRYEDGEIPLGQWVLLFWCLDVLDSKQSSIGGEGSKAEIERVVEYLIECYLDVLRYRVSFRCNSSDDPEAFEELGWEFLVKHAKASSRRKLIFAFDDFEIKEIPKDSNLRSGFLSAVRTHIRLLLSLYASELHSKVKVDLVEAILSLTASYGFGADRLSGVFENLVDESSYSRIRLWKDLCEKANIFGDDEFKRLVNISKNEAPLSCLLKMYVGTNSLSRKSQIQEVIDARDLSEEKIYSAPEISKMIAMAANIGLSGLVARLLKLGRENAHKSFQKEFDSLETQIELKDIFESSYNSVEERVEALKAYQVKGDDATYANEMGRFKRYLLALAYLQVDANKALAFFELLLKEKKQIQYATGVIKAHMALSDASSEQVSPSHYRRLYASWLEVYQDLGHVELGMPDVYEVLSLLKRANDPDTFEQFWKGASSHQRNSFELAPLWCEHLRATGRIEDALAHLAAVKEHHGECPASESKRLEELEDALNNENFIKISGSPYTLELFARSSHDQAGIVWRQIGSMDARQQCRVIAGNDCTVEKFISKNTELAVRELLSRKSNLQRKKVGGGKTIPLDDEDMINDWLVSILRHRLNYLKWTVADQSRAGKSASGKGVGEGDGWIFDGDSNRVSLLEAFRVQGLNTTVINEHLNKVAGYNSVGASPIIVVVYVASPDFNKLCMDYQLHINSIDYEGFDTRCKGHAANDLIRESHLSCYHEVRSIQGCGIHFYHYLVDLYLSDD
ncbi:hypothetical protein LRS11_02890 [Pseudomonas sp. J452]|uniref:hypothetical protein n=1 Tax=Pseudomonas sp. J452 TaxID=2898441 RepID=UPI0021ADF33A|nr:hypothetical protein [Pseudomonas sp. J452]UUY08995.1 hypothetical protein LRS11_02890 [Pseudomonas sp. J452]